MGSRKIEDLDPLVQPMWHEFKRRMLEERKLEVRPTSTIRTADEQLAYFAQARKSTKAVNELRKSAGLYPITPAENKKVITSVLTSVHEFGFAVDFVIMKEGAAIWEIKADLNKNDIPDYEEAGKIAEECGLTWGGKFKRRDYVHIEYTGGLTIAELQQGKRPEGYGEKGRDAESSSA